ncbi:MAG: OmpA family protein [Rhodospirillales bacterium]
MRHALLSAALLLGVAGPVWAQSNPNADQIIKSLSPITTGGESRGVRIATPTAVASPVVRASAPAAALPSASLSVLFATGSAELTPTAVTTLNELGKALTDPRLAGGKFRIEGHTDTVGTMDGNKALSEARAKAVADYLATTYRVDPGKLQAIGMGEEGLLIATPNQTPEPRNRRVVVVNLGG